jgi:hypothetical protein
MVQLLHQTFIWPLVCWIFLTKEPLLWASQPCCHLFSCNCGCCSVASFSWSCYCRSQITEITKSSRPYTYPVLMRSASLWVAKWRCDMQVKVSLVTHLTLLGEVIKHRVFMVQNSRGLLWNVTSHGIDPRTSWIKGWQSQLVLVYKQDIVPALISERLSQCDGMGFLLVTDRNLMVTDRYRLILCIRVVRDF